MKVLTVLLPAGAIWLFVRSFAKNGDNHGEAIRPVQEEPSLTSRLFKTPTPVPPEDLRFAR